MPAKDPAPKKMMAQEKPKVGAREAAKAYSEA